MPTTRIDLAGRRFGKLTVVGFASSSNSVYWSCRCDCGTELIRRGGDLLKRERSGNAQSCGCAHARAATAGLLRCGKCRAFKPEAAFRRDKRARAGFHGHCNECQYAWHRENSARLTHHSRLYYAKKLCATPGWADAEKIVAIYAEAKRLGLTVDHIIPLKSSLVCGLHVENNLQLLSKAENSSKRNHFIPGPP